MQSTEELLKEIKGNLEIIGKDYPDFMKAFGGLMHSAEKPGALDGKTKELIAVALSIAGHCSWCIAHHVKGALDKGASRDEIMEACFVAVLMGGGPSLMYTQLAMKALDDLSGKA